MFKHLVSPEEVAAIVVEPIQGEGGYVPAPPGFLAGLRALCDEHGILLVADEIQSGVGRTGRFWAVEHDGVVPDVLLAGKGLASGLPLGAIIARADLMTWPPGTHGSTFGGNPVVVRAALATHRPRGVGARRRRRRRWASGSWPASRRCRPASRC